MRCYYRFVLRRRLRRDAIVHGRLLWPEISGRHLWLDSARMGGGRDSFADPDCTRATVDRHVRSGHTYSEHRGAGCAHPADSGAQTSCAAGTRGANAIAVGGVKAVVSNLVI